MSINRTTASQVPFGDYLILHAPRNEAVLGFLVIEVVGTRGSPTLPARNVALLFRGLHEDITDNVDQAKVFLEGQIKWDGCSDWLFNQGESGNSMLHFCGSADAVAIGALLGKLYEIAKSEIEQGNNEVN